MPGPSVDHEQPGEISGLPGELEHTTLALTLIKRLRGDTCQ